jgi:hypothetical protein
MAAGGQQGGSRVEMLTEHGRCCFVVLLEYQPVTEGVCDDVLDVVEGIAGETVIELTQKEKRIKEISSRLGKKRIASSDMSCRWQR